MKLGRCTERDDNQLSKIKAQARWFERVKFWNKGNDVSSNWTSSCRWQSLCEANEWFSTGISIRDMAGDGRLLLIDSEKASRP